MLLRKLKPIYRCMMNLLKDVVFILNFRLGSSKEIVQDLLVGSLVLALYQFGQGTIFHLKQ